MGGSVIADDPGPDACVSTNNGSQSVELNIPDIDEIDICNFHFIWHCSLRELQPIKFNVSSNELIFLEVFAGSGNLSEAVGQKGLFVHAIDLKAKRQTGVSIHILDLTRDNDVGVLLDMATHANIGVAHFAPPCGTSSKARERPLPKEMQSINAVPLRSESHPLGLGDLSGLDAKRVAAANSQVICINTACCLPPSMSWCSC